MAQCFRRDRDMRRKTPHAKNPHLLNAVKCCLPPPRVYSHECLRLLGRRGISVVLCVIFQCTQLEGFLIVQKLQDF